VLWVYFDAALPDAPASARPDTSSDAARIADAAMMVVLCIPASIRFETTQTEQTSISCVTLPCDVWHSTTLLGVLLSLLKMMMPTSGKRKNQSFAA
jgi:hypothetical protein